MRSGALGELLGFITVPDGGCIKPLIYSAVESI
jgi:hypothetical protein